MKKISTLFFILLSIAAFLPVSSQNKTPLYPDQPARKFEVSKKYPVGLSRTPRTAKQTSSRSQNIEFFIDYGTLDSLYNVYGPNNGGGTWYRDDEYSFRVINTSLPPDSALYEAYAFTWFPEIIDFVNNPTWPYNNYDPLKIQMNIDTVYVTLGHVNLSNKNDTIVLSIWDYDAFLDSGFTFAAGVDGLMLGADTIIVDTSILGGNGAGTQAGSFELGTYPFILPNTVVLPTGHRFITQIQFYGPSVDEFLLSSARRNDCSSTCGASVPYVNATYGAPSQGVDSFNSMYGYRFAQAGDTGVFPLTYFFQPCNGGTVQVPCEKMPWQDFDIYPVVTATISQFYVEGSSNLQNVCPNTNVNLTAYGGGSSATPYVYSWTTSRGSLSANTGQQVTLTTDSTTVNDTIIVTLTDTSKQAVSDTFVVVSGGIGVAITNTSPISLSCGAKALITTRVSGSILGRNYIWSTGAQGFAQSTITDSVAGTFDVTVTNNEGCSASASVQVDYRGTENAVNFKLPSQIGQNQYANCPLDFVNTSTSFAAPWTAKLDPLGNGSDDVNVYNGNPIIPYTYASPGVYQATLTMDSAGCVFSTTKTIQITSGTNCTASVQDLEFSDNISLQPNPTNGYLHIQVNGVKNNISVKVYNILGAEIKSFQANELSGVYKGEMDLTEVPSGTYMIRIDSGDQTAVKKLVVSR